MQNNSLKFKIVARRTLFDERYESFTLFVLRFELL